MISILIPTLNRSDFLIRALYYYSNVGFKGYVCIGDSSDAQHVERTKRAIQRLQGKLRIIYRNFPNPPYTHDGMVMKELIELAPTPYAVFAGDDDFVIPNSLQRCAAFLENHPEYSAAHGLRAEIGLQSSGAYGQLAWARNAPELKLESEIASERWVGYMRRAYSTQYSVHRTETWRRMYRHVASVPIRYLGPELLPCSLSSILGKIKELDCLSVVFQENDNRILWDRHSVYSLIIHPDWSLSVQVLRNCIVEALVQQGGIDVNKAREIFDKEFWHHILSVLQWQYKNRYGDLTSKNALKEKNTFKETLKAIPGLTRPISLLGLVRRLRQIVRKRQPDPTQECEDLFSLDSLLNPSSPFYADFMLVYHAITEPSELHSQSSMIHPSRNLETRARR